MLMLSEAAYYGMVTGFLLQGGLLMLGGADPSYYHGDLHGPAVTARYDEDRDVSMLEYVLYRDGNIVSEFQGSTMFSDYIESNFIRDSESGYMHWHEHNAQAFLSMCRRLSRSDLPNHAYRRAPEVDSHPKMSYQEWAFVGDPRRSESPSPIQP